MSYIFFETRPNKNNKVNRVLYLLNMNTGEIKLFHCNKNNIDRKLKYHSSALKEYLKDEIELDAPWGSKENKGMNNEEFNFYKNKIKDLI